MNIDIKDNCILSFSKVESLGGNCVIEKYSLCEQAIKDFQKGDKFLSDRIGWKKKDWSITTNDSIPDRLTHELNIFWDNSVKELQTELKAVLSKEGNYFCYYYKTASTQDIPNIIIAYICDIENEYIYILQSDLN
ncbi:MAG: hypothetical protein E6767_20830 [Dysgonomonas sp.]|nr:hypothetical protein [Dysgonomonas sp.]